MKTQKSSGEVGAPAELPDGGTLAINKDVIAAINSEMDKTADEVEAVKKVRQVVMKKFHQFQ